MRVSPLSLKMRLMGLISRIAHRIQFGNYQLRRTADNGLAFKVKEG